MSSKRLKTTLSKGSEETANSFRAHHAPLFPKQMNKGRKRIYKNFMFGYYL